MNYDGRNCTAFVYVYDDVRARIALNGLITEMSFQVVIFQVEQAFRFSVNNNTGNR